MDNKPIKTNFAIAFFGAMGLLSLMCACGEPALAISGLGWAARSLGWLAIAAVSFYALRHFLREWDKRNNSNQ